MQDPLNTKNSQEITLEDVSNAESKPEEASKGSRRCY